MKIESYKKKRQRYYLIVSIVMFIFISGIFVFLFCGRNTIKNYNELTIFVIINTIFSLIIGVGFLKYIKPLLKLSRTASNNYGSIQLFLSLGLIGHFMVLTNIINIHYSEKNYCDNFEILGKSKSIIVIRRVEYIYYLHLDINNAQQDIICNQTYWEKSRIGERINVCYYESRLGFDYYKITNE